MALSPETFVAMAMSNPVNGLLLARLRDLGLPDAFLVAGCLYNAVWNAASSREPDWGVKDYDVFYHDPDDLSWEAEDSVIRRVAAATAEFGVAVEVRNQARVHLWYRQRFGVDCPPHASSREAIGSFLVACTCVGIEVSTRALHAPYGLDELAAGRLRMTPGLQRTALFLEKAQSYRARWPWLTVIAPPAA